jgi:hypothetical protein
MHYNNDDKLPPGPAFSFRVFVCLESQCPPALYRLARDYMEARESGKTDPQSQIQSQIQSQSQGQGKNDFMLKSTSMKLCKGLRQHGWVAVQYGDSVLLDMSASMKADGQAPKEVREGIGDYQVMVLPMPTERKAEGTGAGKEDEGETGR